MTANFTCKIQLAKHEPDETIDKGEVDFQNFRAEFNAVDWDFEADRLQFLNRTWPAIGVTNHNDDCILWTSPYRPLPADFLDEDEYRDSMEIWWVIRLDNPPSAPEIQRFDTGKRLSDCHFETYLPGEIEDLFELFFAEDYDALYVKLYSMSVIEIIEE